RRREPGALALRPEQGPHHVPAPASAHGLRPEADLPSAAALSRLPYQQALPRARAYRTPGALSVSPATLKRRPSSTTVAPSTRPVSARLPPLARSSPASSCQACRKARLPAAPH